MRIVTLSQLSLAGSSGIAEVKQPIWMNDGNNSVSTTNATGGTTTIGNSIFILDGTTGTGSFSSNAPSNARLFTLSSAWNANINFAFEGTILTSSTSATANAVLYDLTTNTLISASKISTTSNTATVVRSGQFNLTPGHAYGVNIWISNSTYTVTIVDASLIIFP